MQCLHTLKSNYILLSPVIFAGKSEYSSGPNNPHFSSALCADSNTAYLDFRPNFTPSLLCPNSTIAHPVFRPGKRLGFKSRDIDYCMASSSGVLDGNFILERSRVSDSTPRRPHKRFNKKNERRGGHAVCFRDGGNSHSADTFVSCTTFNILAPIYKRLNSESSRESEYRDNWRKRNQEILNMLLNKRSSIICLQEFWVGSEELVDMYERDLENDGYEMYKLGRTNNRGDGLLMAVRKDHFRVVNYRELLFNDCCDRVAQLLHVQSVIPFRRSHTGNVQQETVVVNTHLQFPHNSDYCLVRLRQVYKILEYLETYKAEHNLPPVPIILCGDWNGSKRGHVYKFLRSQGFVSSYDTAHHYTDSDADAHKWVSHRNHRGNVCGVDFIWLLNPDNCQKPLKTSWNEAVFGIIKSKLHEAGLKDGDAFCFFKSEGRSDDYVKLTEFQQALEQLGLTGEHSEGLRSEEIQDLLMAADTDGNGFIDYEEFQRMLVALPIEQSTVSVVEGQTAVSGKWLASYYPENGDDEVPVEKPQCSSTTMEFNGVFSNTIESESGALMVFDNKQELAIGFDVKKAVLFPPEVEKGMWPENYILSDHAPLTVVFAPVRIPRKQETVC
eukprot:Gb_04016 [translate_table: standard]